LECATFACCPRAVYKRQQVNFEAGRGERGR
jgi:hypothetical protein